MALYLFNGRIIALAPITIMPMANMVNAMLTIQSNSSPVDIAAKAQTNLFVLYVAVLVVGGLLTAFLTVLVWRASNRYQDAVKADADARIAEATERAAQANERAASANVEAAKANESAGQANERAQTLERDNLVLRDDVNKAAAQVATLQKDAADARAAQQRVETELARQREKAANAERALLELQERIKPRHLTAKQQSELHKLLSATDSKGAVEIRCSIGDPEAYDFALDIANVLNAAGWQAIINNRVIMIPTPVGLKMWAHSEQTAPIHAVALLNILNSIGLRPQVELNPELPEGQLVLIVGAKP